MPWEASRPVDLKAEFVRRLEEGELMSDLCREYGIHRQTGYEVRDRYREGGIEALLPRSKAPKRIPHKTKQEIVDLLLESRKAHPSWGPKKLKAMLESKYDIIVPAPSTIGDLLVRHGLVERKPQRRPRGLQPTGLRQATEPNDLWSADYKGQFRLGDTTYCYPLTMADQV